MQLWTYTVYSKCAGLGVLTVSGAFKARNEFDAGKQALAANKETLDLAGLEPERFTIEITRHDKIEVQG